MLQLKRILVPIDFSDTARVALEFACELADSFQAQLHLVHVQSDALPYHGYQFAPDEELEGRLEQWPGPPWSQKLTVSRAVRVGPPFLEIITEAKEQQADMIVMGTHGYGPLKHMLIGSVAERVVRTASCPVVTVRHPQHPLRPAE